jgi:hypothetical protein
MTGTLTDRYIWAVQRSLPEAKRDDIDKELRGAIADAIDAKQDAGAAPADAERAAILDLGDPYRLAAGYTERPLHLIGPALFPDYIRLLKVLYAIILPITFAAVLLAQLLAQGQFGGALGATIGITISVAVHLGFWTTLVFALIERSPDYRHTAWNPDTLPQLPSSGAIKLSDTIASAVWFACIVGGVIWAQFFGLYRDGGEVIPILDPALWSFWLPFFLAIGALELAFRIVLYRVGRWTVPSAIISMVLALAFAVPAIYLVATQRLFNPEFLDRANIAALFGPEGVVTVVAIVLLCVGVAGATADGFTKAVRQAQARA